MSGQKEKVLAIVGPTSVGKTALSLELGRRFAGEIISGDSMQFYRGMDIGTAKATESERLLVPHHLIDIRDPDEEITVAEFQQLCTECIATINGRGKLPMLVGGTGLYVQSVLYDYKFSTAGEDEAYREELTVFAEIHGREALHAKLLDIDPETAGRLHPNDVKRIIRALEIYHVTGTPMSQYQSRSEESPYDLLLVGLNMDRALLYERINQRVDIMIAEGLIEEVKKLMAQGYDASLRSMQALGYKEMIAYINGALAYEEAIELLKKRTRNFAKRQLTWFRAMKDIVWFDVTPAAEGVPVSTYEAIYETVAGKFS
ncbi:tRNA (adenosine(37)-N6)-dimethylallyltransferase MiaA [Aneurinibacillus aneurinilyticus]|jgi:tRNA dimethylallyltransferase|uniref:tRNA (adenosine(37)-N6)-dimethylallyltransferase MiaA n=1 Tax=Aneurinibacillus aneurinilyticus TaxID=1391 RepID=UPI0023F72490|nr:tRNA (adenosine(37)-N6)-dimethylallyltransferase MiaA [Aneurinibacillus aneurinilyticus]MCI1696674.1 tRNA (adenosine(37)-N6)-dimethylallyltransferase MiaA [Aneurinibacillus aneurinilyticus]